VRKIFLKKVTSCTALALTFVLTLANVTPVFAHGFIVNDRAHLGSAQGGALNSDIGPAAFEPQSVGEGPRNALQNGLEVYQVITAFGPGNLNGFAAMAEQSSDRWHRVPVTVGEHDIVWYFTMPHRTFGFRYYITYQGWDQNAPLTLDSFEYLGSFDVFEGEGWLAPLPVQGTTHTIEIPDNRTGYHVILGVWDVADVETSWFKVKDVEVSGGTGAVVPTPTNPPTTQPPTTPQPPAQPTPPPVRPIPQPTPPPAPPQPPTTSARAFSGIAGTTYNIGDLISHNGFNYRVLQSFIHNGDPNWAPGVAHSLFRLVP